MHRVPVLAIVLLMAGGGCAASEADADEAPGLQLKYRYLVVYASGPAEWEKDHAFSVRWQGKDVRLPVVFRVAGPADDFDMGSGGELFGHLRIGKARVPVTAKPDTKFQVRNTGVVALVPEKSPRKDTAVISIATSVAISPPDYPGELGPDAKNQERKSSGERLGKRLKGLIAAGRVIEVPSGK
jgi:hypothetical protein